MALGALTELAEIICGAWAGGPKGMPNPRARYFGISIDTRTLKPGDVFFCLKGEKTDGHAFAEHAARRKAAAIVAARRRPGFARPMRGVPVLRVENPLDALCAWGTWQRRRFTVRFTGVTGSVGKTSTKEMIAAVLAQKYPTFKTPGNFNNLLGLPLALQGLAERHRVGVAEMGMSSPGEIARLTDMIDPEIGVVIWIGPGHLEFFKGISAVARAKRELFDQMRPDGVGVVNLDNPILARWKRDMTRKLVGYSIRRKADVYATDVHSLPDGMAFRLNGKTLLELPFLGEHAVSNALAACAVAQLYGIGIEKISRGLRKAQAPIGRLVMKKAGRVTILDDSYNSNPISANAAVETLCALRPPGRKIACLGAMRELGVSARQLHKDVGRAAAVQGVDVLLGVGYWGRQIVAGARHTHRPVLTRVAADAQEAASWLTEFAQSGDVVLVKASHAEGFERIVAELTNQHPHNGR